MTTKELANAGFTLRNLHASKIAAQQRARRYRRHMQEAEIAPSVDGDWTVWTRPYPLKHQAPSTSSPTRKETV
jgi:hypothetical protein